MKCQGCYKPMHGEEGFRYNLEDEDGEYVEISCHNNDCMKLWMAKQPTPMNYFDRDISPWDTLK